MTARTAPVLSAVLLMSLLSNPARCGEPEKGTVRFDPKDDEQCAVPERYRMPARS